MNSLDRFDVPLVVPPLQPDGHHQILLLRLLVGGQNAAHAGPIDRQRLFHEDVFAGLDRRIEMNRPKARRRRENHQVGATLERLAIRVKAIELPLWRHIDRRVFEQWIAIAPTTFDLFVDIVQARLHIIW